MIEGSQRVRNIFVQNQKIEESQDNQSAYGVCHPSTANDQNEEESKNDISQVQADEDQLMTSNPIFNMRVQKNLVAGMNSEKDKLLTF